VPWKSVEQRRWGNSASGKKALGKAGVNEWNKATAGKKLPTYAETYAARKASKH
jgi:hypothetical protein